MLNWRELLLAKRSYGKKYTSNRDLTIEKGSTLYQGMNSKQREELKKLDDYYKVLDTNRFRDFFIKLGLMVGSGLTLSVIGLDCFILRGIAFFLILISYDTVQATIRSFRYVASTGMSSKEAAERVFNNKKNVKEEVQKTLKARQR